MKIIQCRADFDALLRAERAVLFISLARSLEAVQSQKTLEQWEKDANLGPLRHHLDLYHLMPDQQPFSDPWVRNWAGELGDAGAVVWLRKGSAVGSLQNALASNPETLATLTENYLISNALLPTSVSRPPLGSANIPLDPELLKIMCCPETHQPIALAEPSLIQALNRRIEAGQVKNRAGRPVSEKIDAGLVREDKRFLYPVRGTIPVMLIDEAIPL